MFILGLPYLNGKIWEAIFTKSNFCYSMRLNEMINRKRVIICLIVFLMVFQVQTASALTRQDAPDYFSRDL